MCDLRCKVLPCWHIQLLWQLQIIEHAQRNITKINCSCFFFSIKKKEKENQETLETNRKPTRGTIRININRPTDSWRCMSWPRNANFSFDVLAGSFGIWPAMKPEIIRPVMPIAPNKCNHCIGRLYWSLMPFNTSWNDLLPPFEFVLPLPLEPLPLLPLPLVGGFAPGVNGDDDADNARRFNNEVLLVVDKTGVVCIRKLVSKFRSTAGLLLLIFKTTSTSTSKIKYYFFFSFLNW